MWKATHPIALTEVSTSRFSLAKGSTYAEVTSAVRAWIAPKEVKRALS